MNTIRGLQDANGIWVREPEEIMQLAVDFYKHLFTKKGAPNLHEIQQLSCVELDPDSIGELNAEFIEDDVKRSVFSMPGTKAPGPDMPALFFQKYWDIVGRDICSMKIDIMSYEKQYNNQHRKKMCKNVLSFLVTFCQFYFNEIKDILYRYMK